MAKVLKRVTKKRNYRKTFSTYKATGKKTWTKKKLATTRVVKCIRTLDMYVDWQQVQVVPEDRDRFIASHAMDFGTDNALNAYREASQYRGILKFMDGITPVGVPFSSFVPLGVMMSQSSEFMASLEEFSHMKHIGIKLEWKPSSTLDDYKKEVIPPIFLGFDFNVSDRGDSRYPYSYWVSSAWNLCCSSKSTASKYLKLFPGISTTSDNSSWGFWKPCPTPNVFRQNETGIIGAEWEHNLYTFGVGVPLQRSLGHLKVVTYTRFMNPYK